jgi:hypothetical protein
MFWNRKPNASPLGHRVQRRFLGDQSCTLGRRDVGFLGR